MLFIKEQEKSIKENAKNDEKEDEKQYTFEEDLEEIKTLFGDVLGQFNKLQQSNEEIKDRVKNIGISESP